MSILNVTLKQISMETGFSIATISRVISNHGYIKDSTRQKIEVVLKKYGYLQDSANGNNKCILVIMGDLNNWYYMETYRYIHKLSIAAGYTPLIAYSENNIDQEKQLIDMSSHKKYAGILFTNVRNAACVNDVIDKYKIPVVFLNRGMHYGYCNTVCNDNYRGGYQAALYLIQKGHKKIGHLMGSSFSSTALERKRGFEAALSDNGLPITENTIFQGDLDWESGYKYGEFIIKKGLELTAVFSSGYEMTEGLLDCFSENQIRVPEDISIISFDETPSMKRAKITTICVSAEKMATRAMNLLLEKSSESEIVYLRPEFTIRNSVKNLSFFDSFDKQ